MKTETELELFLERVKEKRLMSKDSTFNYLCHYSQKFSCLWEKDRAKIREKAAIFLKEIDNEDVSLGFVKKEWYEVLFIGGNSHLVRVKFIEWCIEKGYKTINDLFI